MWLLLPTLLGCDRLLPPNPPTLEVVHTETIQDVAYPVKAKTAKKAHAAITAMSKVLGMKTWVNERWHYSWTKTTRFYRGRCYFERVELQTEMLGRRPVWTDVRNATAKDQGWWEEERSSMQAYQDAYRLQTVLAREVWDQELRALAPQQSCDELIENAEELFEDLLERRRSVPNPANVEP